MLLFTLFLLSLCIFNLDVCNNTPELVLETSKNGMVINGSIEQLMKRLRQGGRLRIDLKWLATETEHTYMTLDDVYITSEHVCANINSFQWINLEILVLVCTNGFIYQEGFELGQDGRKYAQLIRKDIAWFVDGVSKTMALEITQNGTSGSVLNVVKHVVNGCDLSVNQDSHLMKLDAIVTDDQTPFVSGQFVFSSVVSNAMINALQILDAKWSSFLFHSAGYGNCSVSNRIWTLGSGTILSNNKTHTCVTWSVGCCWDLVYQHDATGNVVYGNLTNLVSYINTGHRVRVVFNGSAEEPDSLIHRLNESIIVAHFTSSLFTQDNRNFNENNTRLITTLSTNGQYSKCKIDPKSNVVSATHLTSGIKWFVDKKRWARVYKTPGNQSSYNIFSALKQGKEVRLRVNEFGCHLFFSPDELRTSSNMLYMTFSRILSSSMNTDSHLEIIANPSTRLIITIVDSRLKLYDIALNGEGNLPTLSLDSSSTEIIWYT